MDDNNGNGRVTNAVQNTKIDQIVKDVGEIKTDLRKFMDHAVDVRMSQAQEITGIKTHIKVIWSFMITAASTAIAAGIRLLITGRS